MRWLIMAALLCLTGCRAVKTSQKASEEMKRNTELTTAAVKTGSKESNILTYWPDGSIYQFEQVREQMEGTKLSKLDVQERQAASRAEVVKERMPVKFWVYVVVMLVIVALIWVYLK